MHPSEVWWEPSPCCKQKSTRMYSTGKDFLYWKSRHVCHLICSNLGLDFPLSGRVGSQPPQQAITIQSLKVELASCLEQHLKVNLASGSKATNIHQTGQSLLCNIKRARVKRESPRPIQVHTRKTLFRMETNATLYTAFLNLLSHKVLIISIFKKGPECYTTHWCHCLSARSPSKHPRRCQLPQHTQTITPEGSTSLYLLPPPRLEVHTWSPSGIHEHSRNKRQKFVSF